jgi:phosphoribosylformimino-5-aminoimidazole carboxamide ribotide isomerase
MESGVRKKFRIIPVIDILKGVAVHAIRGKRNQYSPISSSLTHSTSPKVLAEIYSKELLSKQIYIADLDSIIDRNPNLNLLEDISKSLNVRFLIDLGIRSKTDILNVKQYNFKIIIGTETMESLDLIDFAKHTLGVERIVVSIDIKDNKILSSSQEIEALDPYSVVEKVVDKGIREIILLDLSKVGSKSGAFNENYNLIRNNFPHLEILIGGGVKNLDDITQLKRKGMNGVLIATILHEGLIDLEKLRNFS